MGLAERSASLLAIALLVPTWGCHRQEAAPTPSGPRPVREGIYVFGHPFRPAALPPGALEGVARVYVHDGEWGMRDGLPLVVRGQSYPEGSPLPLMLVYHAEPAFVEALPGLDVAGVTAPLAGRFRDLTRRGLPVAGIQIDFDAGRRGLARYPDLLEGLRSELPGARLSVTALLSGSDDPVWREIASRADEVCPMLYGYDPAEPARFDAGRAARHLASLSHAGPKLVPVLGELRSGLPGAALEVVAAARVRGYLVFDLKRWRR